MFGTLDNPKYGTVHISEMVSKKIEKVTKKYDSEDIIHYIDISSIIKESKSIGNTTKYIVKEAPSRAQQCVKNGDILLSNVRPNLKTIAIVDSNEDNLVCSSGFSVLRCEKCKTEYLITAITDDIFTDKLMKKATGSSYPAVTTNDVLEQVIPSGPEDIQRSFATFIKQVKLIKNNYKQTFDYFDILVKSRFIELFDRYEKVPLTEMANITMGQSPDSSTYNDQGVGVPFFQGKSEFTDTFVQINKYCSEPKKMAKKMDILMSVRAPVGAVNLTNQECCIGRGLAAITPKDEITDVWFLFNALRIMEQQISDMGVGSTFTAISKDDMKKIRIPAAPLPIQIQFSNFVEHIDKSKFIIATILLLKLTINSLESMIMSD